LDVSSSEQTVPLDEDTNDFLDVSSSSSSSSSEPEKDREIVPEYFKEFPVYSRRVGGYG
jgi:hypothetical protein